MNIDNSELLDLFDIRTANEWLRAARPKQVPKLLFGELWLENELAILFADTGKGKSLLGVQIADSIARGRAIDPFEMTAAAQKVLYLDFELSDKQFEMRYASEHEPGNGGFLKNHYRFSERFIRIQLRSEVLQDDKAATLEQRVRRMIEPLVQTTGAKVLIIDNITYLKRTAEGSREAMPLMKELTRLKNELGLSVLVIAHTSKRDSKQPVTVNDLAGSRVLANFADNIFAIGQSGFDRDVRYIKHIKPRSTELAYDSSHILLFRIARIGGNFLGFEFLQFGPESAQLRDLRGAREVALVEKAKSMSDNGMSVRAIAAELKLAKSRVHRLLKMWTPREEDLSSEPRIHRRDAELPGYLPAEDDLQEDEIDEFEGIFERNDDEVVGLRRKAYLLDAERFTARGRRNASAERSPDMNEGPGTEDDKGTSGLDMGLAPEEPEVLPHPLMPSGLMRRLDGYGRDIYVQSESETGKPMIWYHVDRNGNLFHAERKADFIVKKLIT